MVRQHMPRYESTLKQLGPGRTHFFCLAISLLNGCRYCILGHARAFELLYFEKTGTLFPLDEEGLASLHRLDDEGIRAGLDQALEQVQLVGEREDLRRLFELRAGGRAPDGDVERRLVHLLQMFAVLNSCGIASGAAPDEAHDPIDKDRALFRRYRAAREAAAVGS